MGVKEENLALSSGIGLAGIAVSNFWDDHDEIFDAFKSDIIASIIKPNKITAIHCYLNAYQDITEELDKMWKSIEADWTYDFIVRILEEVDLHPNLPEPDFDNCGNKQGHYTCNCGNIVQQWIDYVNDNNTMIDELIIHSAFQFIFQDRKFLHDFHLQLSYFIEENMDYIKQEYPNHVNKKGRIGRQNFPKWMTNAVFYRDKGTCSKCRCDLSNLIRVQNKLHMDHIVPLDLYGSNDASNFQLLCETCNTSKGARSTDTSSVNVPFWNLEKKKK